ncbi:hypothetical protein BKA69DRAFT_510794 [Paraphysoderma sedebokerense]|nr:hypothetical protein BKA69DRAFT_510794 [Paraphysoderma sedebokerense]
MSLKKNSKINVGDKNLVVVKSLDEGRTSKSYVVKEEQLLSKERWVLKWFCSKSDDKNDTDDKFLRMQIEREVKILELIRKRQSESPNPNIIDYISSIISDNEKGILLEYCAGGNLLDVLSGELDDATSLAIFGNVAKAVAWLHELDITHFDIRSENVFIHHHLLKSGTLTSSITYKLADFGSARVGSLTVPSEEEGIMEWLQIVTDPLNMSPELLKAKAILEDPSSEDTITLGSSTDLWQLGTLLFQIRFGQPAFTAQSDVTTAAFTFPSDYDSNQSSISNIITSLLKVSPEDRKDLKEIIITCEGHGEPSPSAHSQSDQESPSLSNRDDDMTDTSSERRPSNISITIPDGRRPSIASSYESDSSQSKKAQLKKLLMISGVIIPPPEEPQTFSVSFPSRRAIALLKSIKTPVPSSSSTVSSTASSHLYIIPLTPGFPNIKKSINAQYVLLHPTRNIVAVSQSNSDAWSCFDLDSKTKLGGFRGIGKFKYAKWISETSLVGVTDDEVVMVTLLEKDPTAVEGLAKKNPPQMDVVFDVFEELRGNNISYFDVDDERDPKWMLLCSHIPGSRMSGKLQLFSVEKDGSQVIDGEFGRIIQVKNELFLAMISRSTTRVSFHLIPLSNTNQNQPTKFHVDISVASDYITTIEPIYQHDRVILISKNGFLLVYGLLSGECIIKQTVLPTGVFPSLTTYDNEGIYMLDSRGLIMHLKLPLLEPSPSGERFRALPSITESDGCANLVSPTSSIASSTVNRNEVRNSGSGSESSTILTPAGPLTVTEWDVLKKMLDSGDYESAAYFASKMDSYPAAKVLDVLSRKSTPSESTPHPALLYLNVVSGYRVLDEAESVAFVRFGLQGNQNTVVHEALKNRKLTLSEELGDVLSFLEGSFLDYALKAYQQCNSQYKVIRLLANREQYPELIEYIIKSNYTPSDISVLSRMVSRNPELGLEYAKRMIQTKSGDPSFLNHIAETFLEKGSQAYAATFLLDALEVVEDNVEYGSLQTKVIKLLFSSSIAEAEELLKRRRFSHFNKDEVLDLCVENNLLHRAMDICDQLNGSPTSSTNPHYTRIFRSLMHSGSRVTWVKAMATLGLKFDILLESVVLTNQDNLTELFGEDGKHLAILLEALIREERSELLRFVLEEVVLKNESKFSKNETLQTLLLLVGMLFSPNEEVKNMIGMDKLNQYDPFVVSRSAILLGFYEEAYQMLYNHGMHVEATLVLVDELRQLDRAYDLANEIDDPQIWRIVGKATYDMTERSNMFRHILERLYIEF